ncbi:ABC transporter ATP-binding protein [Streptomyces sp. SP17BM10]|uniref:ABC transporter ATP-binding protein n=1 Tax=Streptomyces sp. SP17BM10 TaxID=3002530 RepID=UPI002E794D90|nr:ABC transporter ATP-binding protein [Streptomyces sp. SP17BM10]MEE1788736.1 ABC transporter ATP-binding protein [Streptomyces sp. SP17BM10]
MLLGTLATQHPHPAFNRLQLKDTFSLLPNWRFFAPTPSAFMVVGGIAMMAWIDPLLLAPTLACLGTASAVSLLLARRVRLVATANREDTGVYGSALMRVLGALPTVKASRAEHRETEHLGVLADRARRSGVRVSALSALLTPAMNVGTQIALTVVIAWGMARVATGAMAPADLMSFMMYLFYLVAPLVMLFMSIAQFQQGRASLDRLSELGAIEQEDAGPPAHAAVDGHGLVFDGVTFAYPGSDAPVLHDVSLTVPERGLTDVVAALPDGLDTELGERGTGLSGGERQRLASARTLLQKPRIVLLDEATASLDGASEAALRDSIAAIARDRAVVAIAHRFSTITQADRIIVLDRGRVQAVGTHAGLSEDSGLYRRLAEHQGVAA